MNISSTLDLFEQFKAEVGDAVVAGMLTLAHAQLQTRRKPENLSVKQAAKEMGVSPAKVYELCDSGQLAHCKIGRAIRIQPQDLQDFMGEAHRKTPTSFTHLSV